MDTINRPRHHFFLQSVNHSTQGSGTSFVTIFFFQFFNHHRPTATSISMTVFQSLNEQSELFVSIIKIIIMDSRSYLSLWGVRRVSMRAEWFGPLGDRVETVGCFIRMETSRCWLITINMIMIIIVSYLVKYWDDDYEDCDYRWIVGWNPSVVSFH